MLLLDFDTFAAYREFPMRARMLARWMDAPLSDFRIRRFRSQNGGYHIVVYAHRPQWFLTPLKTVCVQALLGSDWKRELFNFVRVGHLYGVPNAWLTRWNVLYSDKLGAFDSGSVRAP